MEISVLLCDVRSVHNVGAIFRTADAAGVSRLYLGGYTPAPRDRFGRMRKDLAKAALGAEKTVAWESVADPSPLIGRLKGEGWRVVGIEQDDRAIDYRHIEKSERLLLIFGNEVEGISKEIRALCQALAQIPQHGTKESLNVSVAAGILLFSLR